MTVEELDKIKEEEQQPAQNNIVDLTPNNNKEQEIPDNYYLPDNDYGMDSSEKWNTKNKIIANNNALEIVLKLRQENRYPTREEQEQLNLYSGWGGIKEIGIADNHPDWQKDAFKNLKHHIAESKRLIAALREDKRYAGIDYMAAILKNTQNAHYTPMAVIKAVYDIAIFFGFTGGKILEPSSGIGKYITGIPDYIRNDSNVTAVEIEPLSAEITTKLHPKADVYNTGFENVRSQMRADLVVGNVPFGQYGVIDKVMASSKDKRVSKAMESIHNYFMFASVLAVKPGGMVALVTSRYTMDALDSTVRELINDHAEFITAVRLPAKAFKNNANTEVVTDLIVLRRWHSDDKVVRNEQWIKTQKVQIDGAEHSISSWFANNPNRIVGTLESISGQFGPVPSVKADDELLNDPARFRSRINEAALKGLQKPETPSIQDLFSTPPAPGGRGGRSGGSGSGTKGSSTPATSPTNADYIKRSDIRNIGNLIFIPGKGIYKSTHELHVDPQMDGRAERAGVNPIKIRMNQVLPHEHEMLEKAGLSVDDFFLQKLKLVRIAKERQAGVAALIKLRDLAIDLINKELQQAADVEDVRKQARDAYRSWVSKYGRINTSKYKPDIQADVDFPSVLGLEKRTGDNSFDESDILTKPTAIKAKINMNPENLSEAILVSLNLYGKLNTNFITTTLNKSVDQIIQEQYELDKPQVFLLPNGNLESASIYLGGNVKMKLKEAIVAAESNPTLIRNVTALNDVQPKPVLINDIYAPLGAPWIPLNIYEKFIVSTTGVVPQIERHKLSGKFIVTTDEADNNADALRISRRRGAGWVLTHAMNQTDPVVTIDGVIDEDLTDLARLKVDTIKQNWHDFKQKNQAAKQTLTSIYNDIAVTTVPTKFDGSHLVIPDLIHFILHAHQKDAVWKVLHNIGGLLDHMVGAGKTLVMLCAAIEGKRMGIFKKPVIAGLKAQIPQMYEEAKKAFPNAKILYPRESDFNPQNRQALMQSIATNDWDIIIISHENFGMMPQDPDIQIEIINAELEIIDELIATAGKSAVTKLQEKREKLLLRLEEAKSMKKDISLPHMGNMGIDFLMIDEAHLYKNLFYVTSHHGVKGLGPASGSKRAFNLLVATKAMHKLYGKADKGVLFATGTPLSNSMVEMYTLMRYLRPTFFQEMNIRSLDDFMNTYAKITTGIESTLSGWKTVTRLNEFTNLPELMAQYREMADVRNKLNLKLPTPKVIPALNNLEPTKQQKRYTIMLKAFVNSRGNDYMVELGLTNGYREDKGMNPAFGMMAMTFAKKLALDPRLINPKNKPGPKIAAVTKKVWKYYSDSNASKGTQLIFCDSGTPKLKDNSAANFFNYLQEVGTDELTLAQIFGEDYDQKKIPLPKLIAKSAAALEVEPEDVQLMIEDANRADSFSVYEDVKQSLMMKGIPENEIAFIHSYEGMVKRSQLYDMVNRGVIRVLIGSTSKMGVGVSVQRKIVAMHHLDMPWRPSDKAQREGRGERQGNENAEVNLEFYATNNSVDSIIYKMVSSKEDMINQVVLSDIGQREMEDIMAEVSMADMAASLSGNPVFSELVEVTKKLKELDNKARGIDARNAEVQDAISKNENLLPLTRNNGRASLALAQVYNSVTDRDDKGRLKFEGTTKGQPMKNLADLAKAARQAYMGLVQKGKNDWEVFAVL
jgi:N12 class adenine-specific DNA methylase